jgi:hypothetical protein
MGSSCIEIQPASVPKVRDPNVQVQKRPAGRPPKEGSKAYKLRHGISLNTHIIDISDIEKYDSQLSSLLSSTQNELRTELLHAEGY